MVKFWCGARRGLGHPCGVIASTRLRTADLPEDAAQQNLSDVAKD